MLVRCGRYCGRFSLSLAKTRDQRSHRTVRATKHDSRGVADDPSSSRGINFYNDEYSFINRSAALEYENSADLANAARRDAARSPCAISITRSASASGVGDEASDVVPSSPRIAGIPSIRYVAGTTPQPIVSITARWPSSEPRAVKRRTSAAR